MKRIHDRRTLSESSEDPDDPSPLDDRFKRPKTTLGEQGRRESQASTTSSVSGPEEDGCLDRDAATLSKALESNSSSDTEDDGVPSQQSHFGGRKNGNMQQYQPQFGWSNAGPTQTNALASSNANIDRNTKKDQMGDGGRYSSKAERMMSMMGHKSGMGLGKAQQGRVEPVGVSQQRGRRGLGHIIEGLESDEMLEWPEEEVKVRETVSWIPSNQQPAPSLEELRVWSVKGLRKEDISDETTFCDPKVLQDVLSCKSIFDKLESHEMMKARLRSNPFETIAKGIFQNRAAMKMANMDCVFDWMFTSPKTEEGRPLVERDEPLYFADVCAGPGGFSEYVLWKRKWKAKGFGFTLKDGSHDFKLEDFFAGPSEGFEPYYGVNGVAGDGNVFRSDNIQELARYVKQSTADSGVHFMMADGGFSVEGSENIQEILSKQLYLCQFIVALDIVRTNGHFVCKVFDMFTPFSVGLLYLLYRSFQQVCIHKPNTSRPANSERYVVCKWKRPDTDNVSQYLHQVNKLLNDLKFDLGGRTRSESDVVEVVPVDLLQQDKQFFDYIVRSNNEIGRAQVTGLEKIAAFYKNRNLHEKRQADVRRECLGYWNVPDQGRTRPRFEDPQSMASRLLSNQSISQDCDNVIRSIDDLNKHVKSVYDWRFVVTSTHPDIPETKESRTFLLSTGRQRVYYLASGSSSSWRQLSTMPQLPNCKLELPAETLLYVELVWEMKGEGKAQRKTMAVHVIDALFLAGEDIRSKHLTDRSRLIKLFLRVMNKPSRKDLVTIREKTLFKLEDLKGEDSVWNCLERRQLKKFGEALVFSNQDKDPDGSYKFFQAKSLLLLRHVKEPFMMALSKSRNEKYFFNTRTRKAEDFKKTPDGSLAEFETTYASRLVWSWNFSPEDRNNGVTKEEVQKFVASKL